MKTYYMKCRKNTENIDRKWLKQKITDELCNQNILFPESKSQYL